MESIFDSRFICKKYFSSIQENENMRNDEMEEVGVNKKI